MKSVVSRPGVVALHGFTGGPSSWNRVAAALGPEYELWAVELPGHAGWTGGLPRSFEGAVDRLAVMIGERIAEPVHLLGYSLGGRLALGLLLEHPELFHSATLIGVRPGLSGKDRDERVLKDERLADELTEGENGQGGLRSFVDRWERLPLFDSQQALPPELLAEQRRLRLSHDPAGLAWVLRTLSPGRMPDYRPRLGEIEIPVRWMAGELDGAFVDIGRDVCDEGPLDLELVGHAGHNLPLEAPAAVARAVRSSLESARFLSDTHPDKQPREQPA